MTRLKDLQKAFAVVIELQEWIESHDGLSIVPCASVFATDSTMEIAISDTTVWSSEVDDDDCVTLDYCKEVYLSEIASLAIIARRPDQP